MQEVLGRFAPETAAADRSQYPNVTIPKASSAAVTTTLHQTMQITILGVTRPAGTHAAKKALDNNHTVVALVRGGPYALPPSLKQHVNAENLKVVKGDATNTEDLKEATKGSDAVLSFLGGRGSMKVNIARDCTKVPTFFFLHVDAW
jgi:hypothetical protein